MTIRPATAGDLDAVVELELTCLGADAWSRGLVEQGIAAALPTVSYLVAEVDGVVVGHAVASAAGDDAELQRIAVDLGHQVRDGRQGRGDALLDQSPRPGVGAETGQLQLDDGVEVTGRRRPDRHETRFGTLGTAASGRRR